MKDVVINGWALEECKKLPDESVDHIATDPPYNIGYADWDKFVDIEAVTAEWYRILKPNGSVFCFAGWSFVSELISKVDSRFTLNDWIIYDRIKGRGAKKRLVSTREDILWFVKSDKWTFNKDVAYSTIKKKTAGLGLKNGRTTRALSNVWTDISPIVPWSKERSGHPTQKPVSLMERIIRTFTNEGDIILDCYCGSGATAIACINLNRHYILIDKDIYWVDYTETRILNHKNSNK